MANTYSNHGFTNIGNETFNEVLDLDKFQTELCYPFIEYTTATGAKVRLVATGFDSDFAGRVSLKLNKYVEEDAGKWVGKNEKPITSTRTLFVDSNGLIVDPSVALEDDTTREILDSEGNSYNPKRYKKKLVAGHNNEFDFFVKNFFKGSMITSDYVLNVLATQAGVTLPA